jgi:hypothetical protein
MSVSTVDEPAATAADGKRASAVPASVLPVVMGLQRGLTYMTDLPGDGEAAVVDRPSWAPDATAGGRG